MVEVHIPKKGIHGRMQLPPKKQDEDELPDELQVLREIEDHETLAIKHLERSNSELAEFLEEEDDADFREAIAENVEVLARKLVRLEKVREQIRELYPNAVAVGAAIGAAVGAAALPDPNQGPAAAHPGRPEAGDTFTEGLDL